MTALQYEETATQIASERKEGSNLGGVSMTLMHSIGDDRRQVERCEGDMDRGNKVSEGYLNSTLRWWAQLQGFRYLSSEVR
jgi:hypothetical protein